MSLHTLPAAPELPFKRALQVRNAELPFKRTCTIESPDALLSQHAEPCDAGDSASPGCKGGRVGRGCLLSFAAHAYSASSFHEHMCLIISCSHIVCIELSCSTVITSTSFTKRCISRCQ
jgi:hypothetical protein